jgi:hypothetical protein
MHAEASLPVRFGMQDVDGSLLVSVSLTAAPDTRRVVLHRQGARGERVDPDGTKHGDTTYSYVEYANDLFGSYPLGTIYNWQEFDVEHSGAWSTRLAFPFGTQPDIL